VPKASGVVESREIIPAAKASGAVESQAISQSSKKDEKKNVKKEKPVKAAPVEEPLIFHMDIRVGKILSCEPHPTDERLVVSHVDVGEASTRCVVSGLAAFYTPVQLTGRWIVLVVNLGPAEIKGVSSDGRALVATSPDGKTKEIVEPPAGVSAGEKVFFEGCSSPPDREVNSKVLNKLWKLLTTSEARLAQFQTLPFTTSHGPPTVPSVAGGTVC